MGFIHQWLFGISEPSTVVVFFSLVFLGNNLSSKIIFRNKHHPSTSEPVSRCSFKHARKNFRAWWNLLMDPCLNLQTANRNKLALQGTNISFNISLSNHWKGENHLFKNCPHLRGLCYLPERYFVQQHISMESLFEVNQ